MLVSMKIKPAMLTLTVMLSLAAGRARAQSADGSTDVVADLATADDGSTDAVADLVAAGDGSTDAVLDSGEDAAADAPVAPDAGAVADAGSHDASVGDGAIDGAKSGSASDAGPAPVIHLFVNENPGCSVGSAEGLGGSTLVAAGLLGFVLVGRRRRRR
jgi:MYXO-CTERM domain-containing protein